MQNGYFNIAKPVNEPVKSYASGSAERKSLLDTYTKMYNEQIDIPMYIGGKEVRTGKTKAVTPPHDHQHVIGHYHQGGKPEIQQAIAAALKAKPAWEAMPWQERAAIFMKAGDLLATKYRYVLNAATMLAQSKNVYQAEIDSACELIDFFRFNVYYMSTIYKEQPLSPFGMWNRLDYRPLEGFVFALTPFNFTAIAGNLPTSPAMMGNTVVWKPSNTTVYTAYFIMQLLREAGLPDGVINLVYVGGKDAGAEIFPHCDFAGIHFTGSTGVFHEIWKAVGDNVANYRTYPRLVGETGGKDFIVVHPTAYPKQVVANLIRGAFEYQGQKCSAASRAYIPQSMWPTVKQMMVDELKTIKMGPPSDPSNFVNAVIDKAAFESITGYIDYCKSAKDAEIIFGGNYDGSKGYFIDPTVVVTTDPHFKTMEEEIFGPVLTIYVYKDEDWTATLELVDNTSPYALTGAVFANDRAAIVEASNKLHNAAGNFYINDKPTGAVVGQQPFGGARASGTNDKAGSHLNLLRWVSPQTIKETFVTADDYRYPFLG
ncbi:MAG: L-glutamate gamma-semialdehyde dehydrogenase [Prevotellaceae bacterium]|jgi:1-pyrroline-5-carboxylate dehydrogenase|nr:L-glutamate gamma-semialdehyde dehydrogenase [Prevotellaceae bacterium]